MNPLLAKLKKTSTIEEADVLSESEFFHDRESVHIGIPMLDVALSGDIDGGFYPGITMWAGPSKHFKTMFSLIMAKMYMDKFPDAVMLFYDSEFGTPISYFSALNIDMNRVLHVPLLNIENLKFDIIAQLEAIDNKDKVIIVIDSVGNIASKKEVEDAKDQKSVADMSRAKQLKSLFRMVTPYLVLKDIPCVVVNHTYKEQSLFPKDIVSGGCVDPETLVQMADGSLKMIKDISPGESVKTLLGPREVTHTWNKDTLLIPEPECYEIEFDDGSTVLCSDIHRFLNEDEEWIEAKDIQIGDSFLIKLT